MAHTDPTQPPSGTWPLLKACLAGDDCPDEPACIDWLEQQGCVFEYRPTGCPRLVETAPAVWADYIKWQLQPDAPVVQIFQQTASTQDAAWRLVEGAGGKADGAMVIAVEQTAGRGRLGRQWQSPVGSGVTFSMVYVYDHTAAQATLDRLVAATAVGLSRGIEAAVHDDTFRVDLKWPNDLMHTARKLGGILVETRAIESTRSAAVIGVGINVGLRPEQLAHIDPALPEQITSVADSGYPDVDRLAVLAHAIKGMRNALYTMPEPDIIREWRIRSMMIGGRMHLRNDGRDVIGAVVDLDLQHGLVVRTDAGSIMHLPAATTTVIQRLSGGAGEG